VPLSLAFVAALTFVVAVLVSFILALNRRDTRMNFSNLLNEPVLIGVAIRATILAVAAFGFKITVDQIAAVMLAVEAVLALVTRAMVAPNKLVQERMDEGRHPVTGESMPAPTGNSTEKQAPTVADGMLPSGMLAVKTDGSILTEEERQSGAWGEITTSSDIASGRRVFSKIR
jgi:hypothetical protein